MHADYQACPERAFTFGEVADKFSVAYLWRPLAREKKGCQLHVLSFLGECWGMADGPRRDDDFIVGYTRHIYSKGGSITWDVPIGGDGSIPEAFVNQLTTLRARTRK